MTYTGLLSYLKVYDSNRESIGNGYVVRYYSKKGDYRQNVTVYNPNGEFLEPGWYYLEPNDINLLVVVSRTIH